MTYGDLVTLLLVFFVLLYTLTPGVEDEVFDSFISYFQKSPGFFDAAQLQTAEATSLSDMSAEELMEERLEQWQAFADFLEQNEFSNDVTIDVQANGVKITLSDSLTFESGSAELLDGAKRVLSQIGETVGDTILGVEVQGHTDNIPVSGGGAFSSNWYLGAARSVSVVQFLQQSSSVDPGRFKASSFGEYSPVADNASIEGRRKNRRVEIYLRDIYIDQGEDALDNTIWF